MRTALLLGVLALAACSKAPVEPAPESPYTPAPPLIPPPSEVFELDRGPSRARLATLLHECREANREHLRMLRAYEAEACQAHPEQAYGKAEYGLGGR